MMDFDDDSFPTKPSRNERKREAEDLQKLGEALVELPPERLRDIPMSTDLADNVRLAQRIKAHGGRRRQLQLIGKLMRQEDPAPIREALARLENKSAAAIAEHHQAERWRDRLIAEGETAVTEFLTEHVAVDRQRLRQLVRSAQQEKQTPERSPTSARALFRLVRDAIAGSAGP